jgi:hypothetical protein
MARFRRGGLAGLPGSARIASGVDVVNARNSPGQGGEFLQFGGGEVRAD